MPIGRLKRADLSQNEAASLLRGLVKRICASGPVCQILVFGSMVHSQMTDDSDLDIAVIVPDGVSPREFRAQLPSPLCSWPLDLVIVGKSRFDERKTFGGVLMEIFHEGVELYPEWKWKE